MNSFQTFTKVSKKIAIRPGSASGMLTRRSAPKGEQPSISAASSRSRGMASKKPLAIQTLSGRKKPR
jgi:hypothetical protein